MISQIRNSVFIRVLFGLLGLYLLNISVDTADPNPEHIAEDLSFNDQESIVEIIVEKVLGFENAIKEYDDHDTQDHNKKVNVKIDLISQHTVDFDFKQSIIASSRQKLSEYRTYLTNGFRQLDTPPPKI